MPAAGAVNPHMLHLSLNDNDVGDYGSRKAYGKAWRLRTSSSASRWLVYPWDILFKLCITAMSNIFYVQSTVRSCLPPQNTFIHSAHVLDLTKSKINSDHVTQVCENYSSAYPRTP